MSDVEYREVQSATALSLMIRLIAISLGLLITLAWNGVLIFGAGRLLQLW
jgi:type III secretory pathway component EscS